MSDTKPSFNGEVAVSGAPEEGRYSPVGDDYETEELLVEEETEEETEEHSSKGNAYIIQSHIREVSLLYSCFIRFTGLHSGRCS